jgi:hypothetical protein
LEINELVAKATEQELEQYGRVIQQKICRAVATKLCSPTPPDKLMVLIDGMKAWKYCDIHAEAQSKIFGQTPIRATDFLRSLGLRKQAIKDEQTAQAEREAAAETARIQAETDREKAAQEVRLQEETQKKQIQDVESFLAKEGNVFFSNWTEVEYVNFLETWPESALCATLCGRNADYVLIVPQTTRRSESKAAELRAACEECKQTAESLAKLSRKGEVQSFPYQAFRLYFTNRLEQLREKRREQEQAASLKRLKTYLKSFLHNLGQDQDDSDLDQMINNMEPAFRANLQSKADEKKG